MKKLLNVIISICLVLTILVNITACDMFTAKTSKESEKETTKAQVVDTTEAPKKTGISKFEIDQRTLYPTIVYGSYEQDNKANGNESLLWLAIDSNADSILLLSKYIIDCKNYNEVKTDVSFNKSDLKSWLNENFLATTFTSEEQDNLLSLKDYTDYQDKVSLLSNDLARKYFGEEDNEKHNLKLSALTTAYAKAKGVEVEPSKTSSYYQNGSFYLTDNGTKKESAMWVGMYGHIYKEGQSVTLTKGDGIRPLISISKNAFSNETLNSILSGIINSKNKLDDAPSDNISQAAETTTVAEAETTRAKSLSKLDRDPNAVYKNTSSEKFTSQSIPAEGNIVIKSEWTYGKTPMSWEFIPANKQIVYNYAPNSSTHFAIKHKASSGEKGCYLPVLKDTDNYDEDYEGRFFCFEDYTKKSPEEMSFANTLKSLNYNGLSVYDILSKKYVIEDINKAVFKANGTYVNVVYVTELDEILENYN